MDPPGLQRTVTGEMKGFVPIGKFQSLKGLQIQMEKTTRLNDATEFYFNLKNNTDHTIFTTHEANPCLAVTQNQTELMAVLLDLSTEKTSIEPGGEAQIRMVLPKNLFSEKYPLVFYTRTKENIRGEILTVHPGKL
jgi:hypothetical protein